MRGLQLHEVSHQVGDVKLPVWTEEVTQLAPGPSTLRHKLGEDAHRGMLELQGTTPASLLFLFFFFTVPSGPVWEERCCQTCREAQSITRWQVCASTSEDNAQDGGLSLPREPRIHFWAVQRLGCIAWQMKDSWPFVSSHGPISSH